jgi:hypothetical protein
MQRLQTDKVAPGSRFFDIRSADCAIEATPRSKHLPAPSSAADLPKPSSSESHTMFHPLRILSLNNRVNHVGLARQLNPNNHQ